MTRRPDGTWELTTREVRGFLVLWPLLSLAAAGGGAWYSVKNAVDQKLDKSDFVVAIQAIHTTDSLLLESSRQINERVQEIVCPPDRRGCR